MTRVLSTIALLIGIVITALILPQVGIFRLAITNQPLWAQAIEVLVIGDFLGYWSHRWFHNASFLWPIHAVHHSSEQVDWLSSVRVHPLDTMITRLIQIIPLYVVGFSGNALAPYTVFLTIYSIYIHANVAWDYGPVFKYVFSSPTFHRWHHSAEEVALYKNFSGFLPIFDLIFGTAYFPDRRPIAYGLYGDRLSANIFTQLWYPFKRRRSAAAR